MEKEKCKRPDCDRPRALDRDTDAPYCDDHRCHTLNVTHNGRAEYMRDCKQPGRVLTLGSDSREDVCLRCTRHADLSARDIGAIDRKGKWVFTEAWLRDKELPATAEFLAMHPSEQMLHAGRTFENLEYPRSEIKEQYKGEVLETMRTMNGLRLEICKPEHRNCVIARSIDGTGVVIAWGTD